MLLGHLWRKNCIRWEMAHLAKRDLDQLVVSTLDWLLSRKWVFVKEFAHGLVLEGDGISYLYLVYLLALDFRHPFPVCC
jgi:hypothetical protein